MKTAVVTFPGSNCNRDMFVALKQISGKEPINIWHTDTSIPSGLDLIAVPGGFSFGDYLRSGAIAAKSPIMNEIIKAAHKGVYVLGVCNGFQILTESGLLPGTLIRNSALKFICKSVTLRTANNNTNFTNKYKKNQLINIPIAHHDGNYFAGDATLKELEDNDSIAFYYEGENPNGSLKNIAGVFNKNKNVLGMMPHPERAIDQNTGSIDGINLFKSLLEA